MRTWKQRLAALLAAVMLVSLLPAAALAEEEGLQAAPVVEDVQQKETSAEDDVTFNTGCMEIIVTADESKLDSQDEDGVPLPYVLFEEDGGFTIPLERGAFFPYEVQFRYGGRTWEEWFMDPEDIVEIGGHTFRVVSEEDPDTLTQIGVWVGDTYVPAYPEKKEFTNDGGTSLLSMGPLLTGEVHATLDLSDFVRSQLTEVQVSTVIAGLKQGGSSLNPAPTGSKVAWVKQEGYGSDTEDNFKILDSATGVMDLSTSYYRNNITLALIVGTALQLDLDNNTLYKVEVTLPPDKMFSWGLKDSTGADVLLRESTYTDSSGETRAQLRMKAGIEHSDLGRLSMNFVSGIVGKTAKVYAGTYETVEALEAANPAPTEITGIFGSGAAGYDLSGFSRDKLYDLPFTVLITDEASSASAVSCITVCIYEAHIDIYPDSLTDTSGTNVMDGDKDNWYEDDVEVQLVMVKTGLPANGQYVLKLVTYVGGSADSTIRIEKAVVGLYNTLSSAGTLPDVKEDLFTNGYTADFSGGVNFTVFDEFGDVHKLRFLTETAEPVAPDTGSKELSPLREDTYFCVNGINSSGNSDTYVMPYSHDSYYSNGYQTVLTTDDTLDLTQVKLLFTKKAAKIVAKKEDGTTPEQASGVTENDFSNGPVHFAAAAENGQDLKNYFVTVVKKEAGAGKLFVNGINGTHGATRTIFLTDAYENRHDIFIANVGGADLTNLTVTLTEAEHVKLDEYWTVGGASNNVLKPLELDYQGATQGVAKIRLLSDGTNGEVKGKLTISADGITPVEIQLTGIAFAPEIVTSTLPDGVKYVPYGQFILTNNEYDWLKVKFTKNSGKLPEGVDLKPNGEIYGTPKQTGSFNIRVQLDYTVDADFAEEYNYTGNLVTGTDRTLGDYFYLYISDNTDENVDSSSDANYSLLNRVPDNNGTSQQLFRSEGIYSNYVDFWLDGGKLAEGTDYVSADGSTRITIQAQTLGRLAAGRHTIAAEFRAGGKNDLDSPLRRTAQNFTITTGGSSSSGGSGSSGGSSSSGDSGDTRPAAPKDPTPAETPKTAADIFTDIRADQWFYPDVNWGYQSGLMMGMTDTLYQPYGKITPATAVVVLARMDQADLSPWHSKTAEGIPAGQWYSPAASWAKSNGILGTESFDAQAPIRRGQMAIMLLRYLQYRGVDCALPYERIPFTDAALMTQEENDAFQVLYQFGIFKGIGNYTMDVNGTTTRAQFAALIHRMNALIGF